MAEWQAMEAAMRERSLLSDFIRSRFVRIGRGLLDDFAQRPLQLRAFQAHWSRLYGKCLWTKGFHLKTVVFKLLGNARKNHHLLRLQFHQQRHQQTLALHLFHLAVAQDLLKKHPFMCNMLVDDP